MTAYTSRSWAPARLRGCVHSAHRKSDDVEKAGLQPLCMLIDGLLIILAGVTRQRVELLLPGDIDGSGYPGGIKQQFVAVRDMVEAILLQLKQLPGFQVLRLA